MKWTEEELKADRPWNPAFGHGTGDNSFVDYQEEWVRRKKHGAALAMLTDEIEAIFEPRYITPPETSEFIEALVTMIDARRVLEIGMYSGFTTLHILRAIWDKAGAKVTAIDCRPGLFRKQFFEQPEVTQYFEFVLGTTPEVLGKLNCEFDLVFIDSDHSPEHTKAELAALWPLTHPGTVLVFHDLPEWPRPDDQNEPPVRKWILEQVSNGTLYGLILPTCWQLDCKTMWGEGYPPQCNPHLGVFVRRK